MKSLAVKWPAYIFLGKHDKPDPLPTREPVMLVRSGLIKRLLLCMDSFAATASRLSHFLSVGACLLLEARLFPEPSVVLLYGCCWRPMWTPAGADRVPFCQARGLGVRPCSAEDDAGPIGCLGCNSLLRRISTATQTVGGVAAEKISSILYDTFTI